MKKNPRDDEDKRSEDAPVVAEPESFGTWLRRQREVREIDLREIADSSKVSMSYLQAFEEDRFDVLPSPVFAKGFLRQYARYVGLDPEEVVNFYLAARHPEGEAEPNLQPRTAPEVPSRKFLYLALILVAALVLLVGLLSMFGEQLGSRFAPSPSQPEPTRAPIEDRQEADVPETTAPETTAPETTSPVVEASTVERLDSTPEVALDPGLPVRVTLDFMSDCWVEASIDGVKELSQLKVQGESLLLSAEEVVEFKVGDVGAVQVEVNGISFEPENREGTSVRTVRIDLETVARLSAGSPALPRSADLESASPNAEDR